MLISILLNVILDFKSHTILTLSRTNNSLSLYSQGGISYNSVSTEKFPDKGTPFDMAWCENGVAVLANLDDKQFVYLYDIVGSNFKLKQRIPVDPSSRTLVRIQSEIYVARLDGTLWPLSKPVKAPEAAVSQMRGAPDMLNLLSQNENTALLCSYSAAGESTSATVYLSQIHEKTPELVWNSDFSEHPLFVDGSLENDLLVIFNGSPLITLQNIESKRSQTAKLPKSAIKGKIIDKQTIIWQDDSEQLHLATKDAQSQIRDTPLDFVVNNPSFIAIDSKNGTTVYVVSQTTDTTIHRLFIKKKSVLSKHLNLFKVDGMAEILVR